MPRPIHPKVAKRMRKGKQNIGSFFFAATQSPTRRCCEMRSGEYPGKPFQSLRAERLGEKLLEEFPLREPPSEISTWTILPQVAMHITLVHILLKQSNSRSPGWHLQATALWYAFFLCVKCTGSLRTRSNTRLGKTMVQPTNPPPEETPSWCKPLQKNPCLGCKTLELEIRMDWIRLDCRRALPGNSNIGVPPVMMDHLTQSMQKRATHIGRKCGV